MKSPSWPQVVLCLGLVAAFLAAGKFLPEHMAQVSQVMMLIFAFFKDPAPLSPSSSDGSGGQGA